MEKDWAGFVGKVEGSQYQKRIQQLKDEGKNTDSIETAIQSTLKSFNYGDDISFVIFGEPQSGKTELMIALNSKLIDEGCEVIINLVPDSVDLLQQNLARFKLSGLSPSPKEFSELPQDAKALLGKQWIIFSKKNPRDLEKLLTSLRFISKLVIIDDEADFASPNAKINQGERTKINELINRLLDKRGKYIGVTATPARLDLNNTFENITDLWVDFSPHPLYVGQEYYFPEGSNVQYRLHTFKSTGGNERTELKNAIYHFLCGVAEQHQKGNKENFTMIIHTSGKTREHDEDHQIIENTIGTLSSPRSAGFKTALNKLKIIAREYNPIDPDSIVEFILRNINRNQLLEINSKKKKLNISDILTPKSLFSFGVGGNIISRGVTFENLLSMYFTRGVKGKLAQDTYIQRARMFGNREKYKNEFQLWITDELMADWAKCFIFHRLAIQSARSGMGAPVWLADFRTTPTSPSSINRQSVDFEDGEMSFGLFEVDKSKACEIMIEKGLSDKDKIMKIKQSLSEESFPEYIYNYLQSDINRGIDICFHTSSQFGTEKSNYSKKEISQVRRTKGIFSTNEFARGNKPNARNHLKIFYNDEGKARLFYKINGKTIKFIQNRR